jgi:hypothetical protein
MSNPVFVKLGMNIMAPDVFEGSSRGIIKVLLWCLDNAVYITTGYGLDDRGFGIRVPVGTRIFSTSSRLAPEVHPASYRMGAGGSFPGGKAPGA